MAAADDPATTGQKTHRYLRLSLVLIVFALLVAVALQSVVVSWEPLTFGWQPLPSISHAFYTPVRDVFVGALIATSVALLALSGRSRATTLLDVCAVFAPLIAIVPTGVVPTAIGVSGIADAVVRDETSCPGPVDCIPVEYIGGAKAGIAVYALVVLAVVITMAVIRAQTRTPNRAAVVVSAIALVTATAMAALAFVPALDDAFPFTFWPVHSIHFVVTLVFFSVFAAVPILYAGGPLDPDETPPTPIQRTIYRWIAGLLIVDLLLLVAAVLFRQVFGETPVVLIGEAVALILFGAFWWVQTFQRWDDVNPPSIVADRRSEP
ncbi:hypothetical protein [Microbacterium sp. 3J1]|uniref:hypothetical protein n=1 Tax=Microbacterium sp. 3J1 TaxID=861269 RepID=UPI000B048B07|nr:hypothetical protein [Microbacterium sp. 3J1]